MKEILKSPFEPPLKRGKDGKGNEIEEIETVWGNRPYHSPKLIVGISLTNIHITEKTYSKTKLTIPAILDTGFNRILEIDERQLYDPVYSKEYIDYFKENTEILSYTEANGRSIKYFYMPILIWIHHHPYEHFKKRVSRNPFPLNASQKMRVIIPKSKTAPPWPSLPLLGLQALKFNNLSMKIRSCNESFEIHHDEC